MLQTIRERLTGPFVWFVVALIVVPFAFFGIETFRTGGGDPTIAKVGDQKITTSQFRAAYEQRLQQYQQLLGENFHQEQFDQAKFKREVLDDMTQELLMREHVKDAGYRAADAQLFDAVSAIPQFRQDGKFSTEAYRARLAQQGYTPARFEAQLRDSLTMDQLREGVLASTFVPESEARADFRLAQQQRQLTQLTFETGRALAQVQVDAAQAQARYEQQKTRYMAPERMRLAYVEVSLDALPPADKPSTDVLRVMYEADKATRFSTPEERRARHLLVRFGPDKGAARKHIDALAEKLEKGADFARLAEAESDDPGSKKKGGDLGWVRRGQMTEKFEQALFGLKKGTTSGPVETEFGWHLIRLDDLHEARTAPFDDAVVQAELLRVYRQRDAERRFQEMSEKLEQVAFETPGSLEPAAKALGGKVDESDWFTREGGAGIAGNAAVVQAAFGEEVQGGENSRVLNLGPSHIAVVRKLDYQAPRQKPFEEVSNQIRDELKAEAARARISAAAKAALEQLRAGQPVESVARAQGGQLKAVPAVKRQGTADVDAAVVDALFRLPRPAQGKTEWMQVALPGGDVALVGCGQVQDADWAAAPADDRGTQQARARQAAAGAEFVAYRENLRKRTPVKIVTPPEAAGN